MISYSLFKKYNHLDILVTLFVAAIIEGFEMDEEEKCMKQLEEYTSKLNQAFTKPGQGKLAFLNPYRYLNPKPTLVNVTSLPPSLVSRVRKKIFKEFLEDDNETNERRIEVSIFD